MNIFVFLVQKKSSVWILESVCIWRSLSNILIWYFEIFPDRPGNEIEIIQISQQVMGSPSISHKFTAALKLDVFIFNQFAHIFHAQKFRFFK